MNTEIVQSLTAQFEASAQKTDGGIEYWLARDVQHLLGYSKWENFLNVVSRAKTACEASGHPIPDYFVEVTKMVDLGSGSQREIDDQMLTRYACYLIVQNGDPTPSIPESHIGRPEEAARLADTIQVQASDLPPDLQQEVLGFIGYLRGKTAQRTESPRLDQARGCAPDFPDRPSQPELDAGPSLS